MNSDLRDFRKEKNQLSMLRYIRYTRSPLGPPPLVDLDGETSTQSTAVTQSTNDNNQDAPEIISEYLSRSNPNYPRKISTNVPVRIPQQNFSENSRSFHYSQPIIQSHNLIDGSTLSPNHQVSSPLRQPSRLLFVKPSEDSDDGFQPAQSYNESNTNNFNMNSTNFYRRTMEVEGSPVQRAMKRRFRIEDDDDDEECAPLPKKTHVNGDMTHSSHNGISSTTNNNGGRSQYDDGMIEKLLDTYCDLYPTLMRIEVFEVMKSWDYNFSEMTKNLDELVRERKRNKKDKDKDGRLLDLKKKKQEDMDRRKEKLQEMRRQKLEEKEREKMNKLTAKELQKLKIREERDRKKEMWKIKGKFCKDVEDEDEDEYMGKQKVYNSDSSDEDGEEQEVALTAPVSIGRKLVLDFFNDATQIELQGIPGCSKKKADVITGLRPYDNWTALVSKFKSGSHVSTDLLNSAKEALQMREGVTRLMKRCERISTIMQSNVSLLISGGDEESAVSTQPAILNPELKMKNYQLIGLNWLALMHQQDLNAVLADEMGLGKTIQAIAFLAYLKEMEELDKLCLIVVPSSTLDNWARELEKWCPTMGFLIYHGSIEERRGMRNSIFHGELDEDVDLVLTTYSTVGSTAEDKVLFKKLMFHTVVFDEAHMLKNMASLRYENLMRIKASRRILLTGTPLQNNLVELMSILVFVMPQLFEGRKEELKRVFTLFPKTDNDDRCSYEREQIEQAKRIMKPFILRRLKTDVLKDLPLKMEEVLKISMSDNQRVIYENTVKHLSEKAKKMKEEQLEQIKMKDLDEIGKLTSSILRESPKKKNPVTNSSSANMVMELRKLANHPLLIRNFYDDAKCIEMANVLKKSTHRASVLDFIIEDIQYMSDFEIHQTCAIYEPIKKYRLTDDQIINSGKFQKMDEMLPRFKEKGDRVLIFSQFCIVLDIMEKYMAIRNYSYKRLDGSTQVLERQELIDEFNENEDIFIFLLSTRAGGLGINLTAANVVILHDIDFNPYNDKQAEDRCHRLGQKRPVNIYRFISQNTIEVGINSIANGKLKLEKDVTGKDPGCNKTDVLTLLKDALGLEKMS